MDKRHLQAIKRRLPNSGKQQFGLRTALFVPEAFQGFSSFVLGFSFASEMRGEIKPFYVKFWSIFRVVGPQKSAERCHGRRKTCGNTRDGTPRATRPMMQAVPITLRKYVHKSSLTEVKSWFPLRVSERPPRCRPAFEGAWRRSLSMAR